MVSQARNRVFFGREDELKQIDDHLELGGNPCDLRTYSKLDEPSIS